MPLFPIDIVGGTNPGRSKFISDESTYNMIVSDGCLIPYSGYVKRKTIISEYSARGLFVSTLGDFMVMILGNAIYKIVVADSQVGDLLHEQVGTLDTTDGDVDIFENGNSQIGIIDNLQLYVWNYSTGDFDIQSPEGLTPITGDSCLSSAFIGGLNTNTFYYSNPNQMIDIVGPPLIPAFPVENSGEIGSDKIVGIRRFKDFIYVFGKQVTKLWTDRGLAQNPFQLYSPLVIEYGCLNKDSIAIGFGQMAWVAVSATSNAAIVASTGGDPQEISSDGIDHILSNLKNPSDCSAFMFQEDGHIFYHLTFKTDNLTIVYDFTIKKFLYATDENLDAHIAKKVVRFNDAYYFVSYEDNSIYEMGSKYYTYDGKAIPRIRITSPFRQPDHSYRKINQLEVVAEQGAEENPMFIDLSISTDGARSFGNPVRRQLGRLGRVNGYLRWTKLGMSRDWTFQYRFYGKGRFVILNSTASVV